ncbi:tagatose-6-phosphate kinase [Streptococcus sp. zg-JUN1979]|uniref:tagatose-6-phosphate kinase n=1 Tax=Streptococcus sp. zg-JUN1979 TaxID=3391450 RepID=UPI0039A6FA5B
MILTITLNPSLDMAYQLDKLEIDTVNRVKAARKSAGGKGLNVTRVLNQVGKEVLATGFMGGETGRYLEKSLDERAIKHDFVRIAGETRQCIALLHGTHQTELLEQGPVIDEAELAIFTSHLVSLLANHKVVVMSGSLPQGLPSGYYAELIGLCQQQNAKVVLDCSGQALKEVLESPYKPTVIKPNIDELAELLDSKVSDDDETLKAILADDLFEGIEWLIVSLGDNGVFAKHKERCYRVYIPKVRVVNPVGSGDSSVAGIASSLVEGLDDVSLLKKANLYGMLNAQAEETGYVDLDGADTLYDEIRVVEV